MKEALTTNQVVIVLVEHPVLGLLLVPYTVGRALDNTLEVIEQAFHASPDALKKMNEAEQKAIDIASHYTEKYLMGVYSREKTVPKFLRKLTEDSNKLKQQIRPFIEKKLLEMLELICNGQLPFYQKPSGSKQLYEHHAYRVHPHNLKTHFSFKVTEEHFSYQLQCYDDDTPVSLMEQKPVVVLTSNPATLLLGMDLYTFSHIEASRLLPFTKKERISADASLTEKYIDNIIIPLARYHDISIQGLKVVREKRPCNAYLYLEDTIYNDTLLRLDFRYGEQSFSPQPSDETRKFVFREQEEEEIVIHYFQRNSTAERKAVHLLQKAGLQCISDSHFKLSSAAPEKNITEWISHHRQMLLEEFVLSSDTQNKPYYLPEIRIEQSCEDGPDWFDLHITVVIGNQRIPFSRFRKNILEGNREYILPDGRIVLLPEEWFSKYANLLEAGKESDKTIRLKRPFIGVIESILEKDRQSTSIKTLLSKEIPVPIGLKANLRSYQQKGFSWLANLYLEGFGGCLADDMGLGKTLQTLALLQYVYKPGNTTEAIRETIDLKKAESTSGCLPQKQVFFDEKGQFSLFPMQSKEEENSRIAPQVPQIPEPVQKQNRISPLHGTLIVVPTSLLHNWKREASRFTNLSMMEYNGSSPNEITQLKKYFDRYHLIFTTYGTMRNNIATLSQYTFECIVLDESQNIKNSESLTFRSAIQLRSKHRLILTGTPIENSLKDLWAQFHFLQPELLGNETTFSKHFINAIRQGDERMKDRLRQLITPFILRRSKQEVTPELPSLTEEVVYCDMTERQNELYQHEKNSLRNILLEQTAEKGQQSFTVLNGILRLRQLSCHPQLVLPDFIGDSGKLYQIIETFETLRSEGHKVLIFSSFVKHLELVAGEFRKRKWDYAFLTGSSTNRPEEIARFNRDPKIQAFLISLKAGGVGLNLTQADYVFIIDPWWNPAAESQAIARAHRIGQNNQVIAYRFITQGSIEEKIIQLQEEKRKLAETFITDTEQLPALTNREWARLLGS
ncbi:MAG: hypothetical protein BACA_01055 [Bacteroides fragilis]